MAERERELHWGEEQPERDHISCSTEINENKLSHLINHIQKHHQNYKIKELKTKIFYLIVNDLSYYQYTCIT